MSDPGFNLYAGWRAEVLAWPSLREDPPSPPERLLQMAWYHQRLLRDQLRTIDATPVRVLHPGFWNHEAGPDFRNAMVQFGDAAPRAGDIEVDLHSRNWQSHGHQDNPNFKNVVLHVVWEAEAKPPLPTLVLGPVLDAPLTELALWLGTDAAQAFPSALLGECCAALRGLPGSAVTQILESAGLVRLQSKAAQLQAAARQHGWDQALWEGLFRALGYKHNAWPMQRLAEIREYLTSGSPDLITLQARMLGIGGLLPSELPRRQGSTHQYVRRLWDIWWRERDACQELCLPRQLWRFDSLRPANHPQRRVVLASHWLAASTLPRALQSWCGELSAGTHLAPSLELCLQVETDEFWSWHWTLRSKSMAKPRPLLGETRVTDLAINVVLPWLWSRACEGANQALCRKIEEAYLRWPAAQDNSVLRGARQRLMGAPADSKGSISAARQQGLLQIVRDFCEHSNPLCENCAFPELVKQWWCGR